MVAGAQPVGGESVSEAPVVPVTTAPDVVMPAVDAPRAEPAGFRTRWESWTHAIFTLREDRFFLLLAVFIGIFSGLVVVCFRLAIEWTQITLLGPSFLHRFRAWCWLRRLRGLQWRCWRSTCFRGCVAAE